MGRNLDALSRQLDDFEGWGRRPRRLYLTNDQRAEIGTELGHILADGHRLMGMEVIVCADPKVERTLDTLDWVVVHNSLGGYTVKGRLGDWEVRRTVADLGLPQTELQWAIKDAAREIAQRFVNDWWDQVKRAPTKDVRFYHSPVWSRPTRVNIAQGRNATINASALTANAQRQVTVQDIERARRILDESLAVRPQTFTSTNPTADAALWRQYNFGPPIPRARSQTATEINMRMREALDNLEVRRPAPLLAAPWITPTQPDPERQRPASRSQGDHALDAVSLLFHSAGSSSAGSGPEGSGG